jgi:hypothetical protein
VGPVYRLVPVLQPGECRRAKRLIVQVKVDCSGGVADAPLKLMASEALRAQR